MIAALFDWHEHHVVADEALDGTTRVVGHAAIEAYSVATRLPPPDRAAGLAVVEFLEDRFPAPPLVLDAAQVSGVVAELHRRGVAAGATYDGLIGLTAAAHGATLLTLDRRAEPTYRRCGVAYRLLDA